MEKITMSFEYFSHFDQHFGLGFTSTCDNEYNEESSESTYVANRKISITLRM